MTRTPTLRVMHVVDNLAVGGAQQLLVEFVEHAGDRGIDTSVAVLAPARDDGMHAALTARGCAVHVVPPSRGQVLLDRSLPKRVAELLVAQRSDVLHAHLEYGTIVGVAAARRAHVPAVVTIHNAVLDFGRANWLKQIAFDLSLRRASLVIACGTRVEAAHRRRCAKTPVMIATNPVPSRAAAPPEARAAVRAEIGLGEDDVVIASTGRITEAKGALDLLAAFALVPSNGGGPHLVYVGTGPEAATVERRASELGLADRVHLLGHRDDVMSVLAASDVFASAAHLEGLPLAMLEAMRAGLPVVATDVGDVGTILDDGRGVVVPARRTGALAAAIREVIDDPPRRTLLADAARRYVLEAHDPGRWVDLHRAAYERVTQRSDLEPGSARISPVERSA